MKNSSAQSSTPPAQPSANPSQPALPSAQPGPLTTFSAIWREAWKIYKEKFLLINGILLVSLLVSMFFRTFADANLMKLTTGQLSESGAAAMVPKSPNPAEFLSLLPGTLLAILIGSLVGLFLNYLGMGSIYQLLHKRSQKDFSVLEALKIAFKRIGTAAILSLRIFIYILSRIIIPILVIVVIIFAMPFLKQQVSNTTGTIISFVLAILMTISVVALVVMAIRASLSVNFSYPLFFMAENPKSKETMQKSISLAKNYLGRIFANNLLLGLIFFAIALVYFGVIALIHAINPAFPTYQLTATNPVNFINLITRELIMFPIILVASGFGVAFKYAFTEKMLEEKGEQVE